MVVEKDVAALVTYAADKGIVEEDDRAWAYNRLLGALREEGPAPSWDEVSTEDFDLEATMARLGEAGVAAGLEEDTPSGRDRVETELMGLMMERPSRINERFFELIWNEGSLAATDWFHRLSCILPWSMAHEPKWASDSM